MKRILTIILTLTAANCFAFSGAAIDKIIKEKEVSIQAERKQQQEAIEAAKTPLDRLSEAEATFFNGKIKAKSDFETNIGNTCSEYNELVRKRNKYVNQYLDNSELIPGTDRRITSLPGAYSGWSAANMAKSSIDAVEQQMDTIRRYNPSGFDLPSCSGEYPMNGGIKVGFTNGKVMDVAVKSNLYVTQYRHDMDTKDFTVLFQSIDGKSDMAIVYHDKKVIRIPSFSNQKFSINSNTGEYVFKTKNVSVGQNEMPRYIEQLYGNCDIKNQKGACATTEELFIMLSFNPQYINQAIKTIADKYIKPAPTAQTEKPVMDVPQL